MPWIMSCVLMRIKLSRTALIQTRLKRIVGQVRELELTVLFMAVGEVGVVGVPAVPPVAMGERYGPGSVKTLAMEGPSVQAQLRKGAAAEQQTAQLIALCGYPGYESPSSGFELSDNSNRDSTRT